MEGRREPTRDRTEENALWKSASERLVAWTVKRHRLDAAEADDTVQEAIQQFIRAGGIAAPNDLKGLLASLGSRVNGIVNNKRRKKANRAVGLTDDGVQAELKDPPDQEGMLASASFSRKAIGVLLERVEGDDLLSAIVMQMAEGIEEPAEVARVLERKVHEVYNAKRRLKAHVEAVKKIMEGW